MPYSTLFTLILQICDRLTIQIVKIEDKWFKCARCPAGPSFDRLKMSAISSKSLERHVKANHPDHVGEWMDLVGETGRKERMVWRPNRGKTVTKRTLKSAPKSTKPKTKSSPKPPSIPTSSIADSSTESASESESNGTVFIPSIQSVVNTSTVQEHNYFSISNIRGDRNHIQQAQYARNIILSKLSSIEPIRVFIDNIDRASGNGEFGTKMCELARKAFPVSAISGSWAIYGVWNKEDAVAAILYFEEKTRLLGP